MKKIFIFLFFVNSLFAISRVGLEVTKKSTDFQGSTSISSNFYVRGDYTVNKNPNKENFLSLGIEAKGHLVGVDAPFLTVGVIVDSVYTYDNFALPIGIGFFSYIPDVSVPLFLRGEFEYAPEVLSFRSAKKFHKSKFEIGIVPIDTAELYVGYKNLGFNSNYQASFYFGVGYNF